MTPPSGVDASRPPARESAAAGSPGATGRARSTWRLSAASGVALAAFLLTFFAALLPGRTFGMRDMHRVYLPARSYVVERVSAGALPEWYPFDGLGSSFVGNVVTGAFHPTVALHFILPDAAALNLSVLLGYAAALAGMARLLRSWGAGREAAALAGLGYALSGYVVSMASNLPYLLSAAALPWACWGFGEAARRSDARPAVAGAFALATALLGGDPQTFAVGALLAVALAGTSGARARPAAAAAFGGVALAAALAGAQLLPALAAYAEVVGQARTAAGAQLWSMHPLRLFDLFVPSAFAPGLDAPIPAALLGLEQGQFWAASLFIGAPTLAFAAAALVGPARRKVALLAAAVGAGVLLALGRHVGLYGWLFEHLPLWRGFRYPEKLMVVPSFAAAALAGLGAQDVFTGVRASRRVALAAAASCTAVALTALVLPASALARGEGALAELSAVLPWLRHQGGLAALYGLVLLAGLALRRPALTLALSAGILVHAAAPVVNDALVSSSAVARVPVTVGALRKAGAGAPGGPRVVTRPSQVFVPEGEDSEALKAAFVSGENAALDLGAAAKFRVEAAVGYLPLAMNRQHMAQKAGRTFERAFAVGFAVVAHPDAPRLEDVFAVEPVDGLPRARLTRAAVASDAFAALVRLKAPQFDAGEESVVEATGFPASGPEGGSVDVLAWAPERLAFRTTSRTACTLFVADGWAAGWAARVDGAPVTLAPADVAGRAVPLPPGEHDVELTYRAPGLGAGLALSGVGFLLAAGLWFHARRREHPAQGAAAR